jgi:hypothetical protein
MSRKANRSRVVRSEGRRKAEGSVRHQCMVIWMTSSDLVHPATEVSATARQVGQTDISYRGRAGIRYSRPVSCIEHAWTRSHRPWASLNRPGEATGSGQCRGEPCAPATSEQTRRKHRPGSGQSKGGRFQLQGDGADSQLSGSWPAGVTASAPTPARAPLHRRWKCRTRRAGSPATLTPRAPALGPTRSGGASSVTDPSHE